ncbi:MAG: ethanolamine permease [Planctomycetaceae bacterium]|nr:ethanolamine permease [Planctomycetaceae bacterium]
MNEPKQSGVARYENVDAEYLEQRKLKKSAGWILLWALGVGAVISGDFGGWNVGLTHGGFGGLAIGTLLMAVMYVCMVFTIAELSAALPHAGGFFSFTRCAFGPTGGFICGLTDTIEYVLTPAVIVYFIGGYMDKLVEDVLVDGVPAPLWWIGFYILFVGINIRGVELTLKVGLIVTLIAMAVLVTFYVSVVVTGAFSWDLLFVDAKGESVGWLPQGWMGVFSTLPFAIWFYLAIEQLPLAAEESHNAASDMPKALLLGIATLLVLSLFTLVFNSGVGSGAGAIGESDAPLGDGLEAVFGISPTSKVFTVIALTGLIASFHTIIYAYGRVLFALSRAGYIPRWISVTGQHHTPTTALIVGALIGLACAFVLHLYEGGGNVGGALLNMAVFGAVISYAMVMCSYIKLRISRPELPRPYRSPLGIPGAVLGLVLSLTALGATFTIPEYRPAVFGVALFVLAGVVYFLLYSRHRLVAQAPEEENALIAEAESELAHQ